MNDMMLQATLLTRASRLSEATALIQRMLRGECDLGMTIDPTGDIAPTRSKSSIVDAKADNIEETDYPHLSAATFAQSRSFRALPRLAISRQAPFRARTTGMVAACTFVHAGHCARGRKVH